MGLRIESRRQPSQCLSGMFPFRERFSFLATEFMPHILVNLVKQRFNIEPQDEAQVMLKKLQDKGFAKDK